MTPIDAGHKQQAHLVDQAGLQESPVDVTASFEQ